MKNQNKRILICGASGFIGSRLTKFLTMNNYIVEPITRKHINLPINKLVEYISGAHAIFNLAGAPILGKWTDQYKRTIYHSRVSTTRTLVNAVKQAQYKPEMFFSASAVGIYDSYEVHDEFSTNFASNFLSSVCIDWEKEAFKLCTLQAPRIIIGRLGLVMDSTDGAFPKMIKPFKLGLGGRIGDGYQCMPFIHINDLLSAFWYFLKNRNCKGIYNVVAPQMVSNREFSQKLAHKLNRPNIFIVPEIVLKTMYGGASLLLTNGQKVTPKRLKDNHFPFEFPTLDQVLDNLIE